LNQKNISYYKLEKMAYLSLKNAIRLHFDSMFLFKKKSFSSALHISILALEEIGKARSLDDYWWSSKVNYGRLPIHEEEKYLKLLYSHKWKQGAAVKWDSMNYSPKFISLIDEKKLEQKKQKSIYVGLPLKNGDIKYTDKIQSPFTIKSSEPKKIISLNNDIFLEMCNLNLAQEGYFDIEILDQLIGRKLQSKLKKDWIYKSGIKSNKWQKLWLQKLRRS
jgi:AbiV family abortive infection protein